MGTQLSLGLGVNEVQQGSGLNVVNTDDLATGTYLTTDEGYIITFQESKNTLAISED